MPENVPGNFSEEDQNDLASSIMILGMISSSLGFVLNALTLAVLGSIRLRIPTLRLLLVSLSAADLLLATATLALLGFAYHWTISESAHGELPMYRSEYCANEVFRWLWDMATNSNLLTLFVMACQQFLLFRCPLNSGGWLSLGRVAAAIAVAWATSFVLGFAQTAAVAITAVHDNVELWPTKGTTRFCYQLVLYRRPSDGGSDQYKYSFGQAAFNRAIVVTGIALTSFVLIALVASYGYIFWVIHTTHTRCRARHTSASRGLAGDEQRVLRMTFVVTSLFIVCFLPLYTYHCLEEFGGEKIETSVFAALMALVSLVPIADPLIYALRLKEVQKGMRRMLFSWYSASPVAEPADRPLA